jgi:hypothetical protein
MEMRCILDRKQKEEERQRAEEQRDRREYRMTRVRSGVSSPSRHGLEIEGGGEAH